MNSEKTEDQGIFKVKLPNFKSAVINLPNLKEEMKGLEKKIRRIKKRLSEPHTRDTWRDQRDLLDLKKQITFLYCLRSWMRGRLHNSLTKPTHRSGKESPEDRFAYELSCYLKDDFCEGFWINEQKAA